MRSFLHDPLVPFLLTTAVVFGLEHLLVDPEPREPNRISLSRAAIEASYAQGHGRAPTPDELEAALDREVEQELMYRYAKALGLAEGDAIVRRRLVQKLGFVLEDLAALETPPDEALRALLTEDADRYRSEDRWDLVQVFTSEERHGPRSEAVAVDRLARLRSGEDVHGEPFVLGRRLEGRTRAQIEQALGPEVSEALQSAELERWTGPLRSRFGLHLIFVERHIPSRPLRLEEARKALTQGWLDSAREHAKDRALRRLRGQYEVVIDGVVQHEN